MSEPFINGSFRPALPQLTGPQRSLAGGAPGQGQAASFNPFGYAKQNVEKHCEKFPEKPPGEKLTREKGFPEKHGHEKFAPEKGSLEKSPFNEKVNIKAEHEKFGEKNAPNAGQEKNPAEKANVREKAPEKVNIKAENEKFGDKPFFEKQLEKVNIKAEGEKFGDKIGEKQLEKLTIKQENEKFGDKLTREKDLEFFPPLTQVGVQPPSNRFFL